MSSVEKVRIWGIAVSQSVVLVFIALLAIGLPAIGIPLAALYAGGAGMVIWAGRQQKQQLQQPAARQQPARPQQPTYPQDRA